MRLLNFAAVSMLLLGAHTYAAQTSNAGQVGAAVENIRFEKGSKVAFVRVVNTSDKEITAFNMSIDVTFVSGRQSHFEHMDELLPAMISKQFVSGAPVLGEGSLLPNERHEVRIDFDDAAQSIHAKVDMVVYLDLSADVDANQDALSRLISWRKERAVVVQQAAEIINGAAFDSVTRNPRGMAINQLKKALAEAAAQNAGERQLELRSIISDLEAQSAARQGRQSDSQTAQQFELRDYARQKSKEAEAASSHAQIGRSH